MMDSLLAFVGGALVKELLAMIGLLAFVGGALVEELLGMSCLLLFVSSLLVNMAFGGPPSGGSGAPPPTGR
jgi:hypothetical protein